VNWCLTSEFQAKQLKSRKVSGENMPILLFLIFGHLFQILPLDCPYRKIKIGLLSDIIASIDEGDI
jgi:hypothetical protein